MPRKRKKNYTYAVGRRRESTARVRLFKGRGDSVVNNIPISDYFPGKVFEVIWQKPFKITETLGKYYVTVNLNVDYLNSAFKGDILTAKSKIIRKGKTIINAECSLYKKDKLIAKGTSNLVITTLNTNNSL